MDLVMRKDRELKRLWKMAQAAKGDLKEQLLRMFWKEYRLHRKVKKFLNELPKMEKSGLSDKQQSGSLGLL